MTEQDTTAHTYLKNIGQLLTKAKSKKELYKLIVNAPFNDILFATQLDLGVVVLLIVNTKSSTIDRIALSDTYSASGAVKMSTKPFKEIRIPTDCKENIIAEAVATNHPKQTMDWKDLFVPALSPQDARFNQAGAGIECSIVYTIRNDKVTGALIFSMYQPLQNIGDKHHYFMSKYSAYVSELIY